MSLIKCRAWSTVLQGGPLKAPRPRGVVLCLGVLGGGGGRGGALGGEAVREWALPLLTLCLFNYCLNSWTCASSWKLKFFLKITCIYFKSCSKEQKLKNKTKPKNQKTQHTGLNRAEVPISRDRNILPEHKVHSTSPCGLAPGSVDSAGNRRVSSCTGCEYVGDYLHLPKLHWYRGLCGPSRRVASLGLSLSLFCLSVIVLKVFWVTISNRPVSSSWDCPLLPTLISHLLASCLSPWLCPPAPSPPQLSYQPF